MEDDEDGPAFDELARLRAQQVEDERMGRRRQKGDGGKIGGKGRGAGTPLTGTQDHLDVDNRGCNRARYGLERMPFDEEGRPLIQLFLANGQEFHNRCQLRESLPDTEYRDRRHDDIAALRGEQLNTEWPRDVYIDWSIANRRCTCCGEVDTDIRIVCNVRPALRQEER